MCDLFLSIGIICLSISVVILSLRVRSLEKTFDEMYGSFDVE